MKQRLLCPALLGASLLLAACNQATSEKSQTPPPPEVAVIEAHPRTVPLTRELAGHPRPHLRNPRRRQAADEFTGQRYGLRMDFDDGNFRWRRCPGFL